MVSTQQERLTDTQFLEAFEQHILPPNEFDHMAHLRLCWLYLEKYPIATATEKLCHGLESYAASLGAKTKFHRTVTQALVRIIANRADKLDVRNWTNFLLQDADIIGNSRGVSLQHYSEQLLDSPSARTEWVEPDIKGF